jgi:hypothetical protein
MENYKLYAESFAGGLVRAAGKKLIALGASLMNEIARCTRRHEHFEFLENLYRIHHHTRSCKVCNDVAAEVCPAGLIRIYPIAGL